jgi:hypothetical protein
MTISVVINSATVGTTEFWLAANSTTPAAQTEDTLAQAWIDFGAMTAGDVFEWRLMEAVNGGTQRTVHTGRVVGVQGSPVIITGFFLAEGWDVGVKKISGTDRSIAWSLRKVT